MAAKPRLAGGFQPWHLLLPLQKAWWTLLVLPLIFALQGLTTWLAAYPIALAIGPFGLAVIGMTIAMRLLLVPLVVYQLSSAMRARREGARIQALIGRELEALKRKFQKDPARLNQETVDLYRRHGLNPLAPAAFAIKSALVVAAVQGPLLLAFYWAIKTLAAPGSSVPLHFLWLQSVAAIDPLFILPVLAAVTTYALARVAARTSPPATPGDPAVRDLQRTTSAMMPIAIGVSAHFVPAALAIYWVTGNLVAIVQQTVLGPRFLS